MSKYNIPEGKTLGNKLIMIEELWVENGFEISDRQIQKIIKESKNTKKGLISRALIAFN